MIKKCSKNKVHSSKPSLKKNKGVLESVFFGKRSGFFKNVTATLLLTFTFFSVGGQEIAFAFYNDTETSLANTFTAGAIDFVLDDQGFLPLMSEMNIEPGATTTKSVFVVMEDYSNPMRYFASTTGMSANNLCRDLNLTASVEGQVVYNGPLNAFMSSATTTLSEWTFEVTQYSGSSASNDSCSFDFSFFGWQTRHGYTEYERGGYSDVESTTSLVKSSGMKIHKVYYDVAEDKGEEGTNEWVELYNPTSQDLDISGWQICDNTLCDTVPGPAIVPMMGYAVVTASSTTWDYWVLPDDVTKIVLEDSRIGNGLENTADMVSLLNDQGFVSDQVNWGDPDMGWANYNAMVWTPGVPDVAEGSAISRNEPKAPPALLTLPNETHWWKLDDGAGTTAVDSAGSVDGVVVGNPTWTTGKVDGALDLDGHTQYISAGGSTMPTGAYTKVAWVKRNTQQSNNNILSGSSGHAFWAPAFRGYRLSAGHTGMFDAVEDVTSLSPNTWYQVAVTYDPSVNGGQMKLFKNGVLIDSATSVPAIASDFSVQIGAYMGSNNFGGKIDDVRLFDTALSEAEIDSLFRSFEPVVIPPPYDTNTPADWFSFSPPTVTLISPGQVNNPNMSWGFSYDLIWDARNPDGPDSDIVIDIYEIEDTEQNLMISPGDLVYTIATGTENDGHYSWTVPFRWYGNIWIKIVARNKKNFMMQDMMTSGIIFDPPAPEDETDIAMDDIFDDVDDTLMFLTEEVNELLDLTGDEELIATTTDTTETVEEDGQTDSEAEDQPAPVISSGSGDNNEVDQVEISTEVASSTASTTTSVEVPVDDEDGDESIDASEEVVTVDTTIPLEGIASTSPSSEEVEAVEDEVVEDVGETETEDPAEEVEVLEDSVVLSREEDEDTTEAEDVVEDAVVLNRDEDDVPADISDDTNVVEEVATEPAPIAPPTETEVAPEVVEETKVETIIPDVAIVEAEAIVPNEDENE